MYLEYIKTDTSFKTEARIILCCKRGPHCLKRGKRENFCDTGSYLETVTKKSSQKYTIND